MPGISTDFDRADFLRRRIGLAILHKVTPDYYLFLEGPLVLVELTPGLGSGISNIVFFFLALIA